MKTVTVNGEVEEKKIRLSLGWGTIGESGCGGVNVSDPPSPSCWEMRHVHTTLLA